MSIVDFPAWLNEQIQLHGWTQAELARRSGLGSDTISRLLSGQRRIGNKAASGLGRALGIPPDDILRMAGELPPSRGGDAPGLSEWIHRYLIASEDERQEMLDYARFKTRNRPASDETE